MLDVSKSREFTKEVPLFFIAQFFVNYYFLTVKMNFEILIN
jgi:hypothetical protein